MVTHSQLWAAIDYIAITHARSPSGLAKRAGLDPTTFNKSKRGLTRAGRLRWPSTESLTKALEAIDMSFEEFAALACNNHERGPAIPIILQKDAVKDKYFDEEGLPVGNNWGEVRVPGTSSQHFYALKITDESMHPVYRKGDRVLVAPKESVRRGDRVVVKTQSGEVLAKELVQMTASKIVLRSINPVYEDQVIARKEVQWIARIIWASQ